MNKLLIGATWPNLDILLKEREAQNSAYGVIPFFMKI